MLVLPKYVAGIRPTSVGFKTYEVAPDFSHSDTVSCTVNSVIGLITVEANADGTMRLTLPEGGTASVRVPCAEGNTVSVNSIETAGERDGAFVWIALNGGEYDIAVA